MAGLAGLTIATIFSFFWVTGSIDRHAESPHAINSATPEEMTPPSAAYIPLNAAQTAALPAAVYDAVIPGLIAYTEGIVPVAATTSYTIAADTPVYAADRQMAVARLVAKNFLAENATVVPVQFEGEWALVLTPSRQQLPSKDKNRAPAQTAAWVRESALVRVAPLTTHIVVSLAAQQLSIVGPGGVVLSTFTVGVGTARTPTPTGVVGYIQARYLDPQQGQSKYPIQLTSLHSSAADEPFGGNDGGLIGMHFEQNSTGLISHGCIRLSAAAIIAVDALPLGTLISITA